jgi:hypothetical protein
VTDRSPEGAAFRGATQRSRRAPALIATGAFALLAVAVLTKLSAPASPTPSAIAAREPAFVQEPTQGPAATAPAATTSDAPRFVPVVAEPPDPPARNPAATPHPVSEAVPTEAGATQLVPAGPTPVRIRVTLPEGWQRSGDIGFVKSGDDSAVGLSISAWSLQHVHVYPCRWSGEAFADAGLMGFARGQAQALASWWGQDPLMPPNSNAPIAPIATKPQATTFGGYPAWFLEVLVPSALDLAACDGGQFVLWDTAIGAVRTSVPGELNRLWVVDANNEPIVIDAGASLGAGPAELAELQAILDSIAIEP